MLTFHHRFYLAVRFYAIAVLLLTIITDDCTALQFPRMLTNVKLRPNNNIQSETTSHHSVSLPNKEAVCDRRSIVAKALIPVATSFLLVQPPLLPANAAIDVSGLRQADTSAENSIIKNQIRSYDGSELTRVQEIQKMKAGASPMATTSSASVVTTTTNTNQGTDDEKVGIASYAYRYSTAFQPRMTKVGNYGEKLRFDDQIMSSSSSNQSNNNNNNKGITSVSFEFPSDWLQLDKMLGGIQFVDQRNGDKLYVLKVKLPPDANLLTTPKQFFGDAIFHPQGAILRSGISVDEYKVKTSTILSDGSVSIPHRRLLLKYVTVTPNGLRTERRAIVDAYEMDNVAYMMLTSSNAVKFDANGRERETVEAIADSFRIEKIA